MWDNLVVFCAANNYDSVKVADQHFAEQLSRLTPVLYVDPPFSSMLPLKNPRVIGSLAHARIRIQAPGLARLTPVVGPFPSKPALTNVTSKLVRAYIKRAVCRLSGGRVSAVISSWPSYSVFGVAQEDVRVYWAQDDFVGGAALLGFNAQHLDACERHIASDANFIVAANPLVANTWRDRGHEVFLIPYGADVAAYTNVDHVPPAADVDLEGPIVGFVGQINSRIDIRLLEEVADRRRSLLLIGPKATAFEPVRFGQLVRKTNVRWLGPKPFSALPSYFRAIDVGIVPYTDSPFNRGSFPLKTLEYLAAGRAVVSTDLPATRWLNTDLVAIASEPEAFADHVDGLLADSGKATLIARRRQFAANHSWSVRTREIYDTIVGWQAPEMSTGARPR